MRGLGCRLLLPVPPPSTPLRSAPAASKTSCASGGDDSSAFWVFDPRKSPVSQEMSRLHHRQNSFKAPKKSLLKPVPLQRDPSCFRFCFAFQLYGNRRANPPPEYRSIFSLPLIYGAFARHAWPWHLLGCRSESLLLGVCGMPMRRVLRLVHPGTPAMGTLPGARLFSHREGRGGCGSGDASPFPVCLLVFWVGAPGSCKEVPKLHSKTAPRYSTHFAGLLRSIQRSM